MKCKELLKEIKKEDFKNPLFVKINIPSKSHDFAVSKVIFDENMLFLKTWNFGRETLIDAGNFLDILEIYKNLNIFYKIENQNLKITSFKIVNDDDDDGFIDFKNLILYYD